MPEISIPGENKTVKPGRRRRFPFFTLLLLIGIIGAIGLFVWAEMQRRSAETQLQQTTQQLEEIKKSTQRSGQEVAAEVLEKVRKHIEIPATPEPTVATVVDVEKLRENNEFYKKANNGDHLIITENRAILYNPQKDIIIDVVPVQIDKTQGSAAPAGPGQTPAPAQGTPAPVKP